MVRAGSAGTDVRAGGAGADVSRIAAFGAALVGTALVSAAAAAGRVARHGDLPEVFLGHGLRDGARVARALRDGLALPLRLGVLALVPRAGGPRIQSRRLARLVLGGRAWWGVGVRLLGAAAGLDPVRRHAATAGAVAGKPARRLDVVVVEPKGLVRVSERGRGHGHWGAWVASMR